MRWNHDALLKTFATLPVKGEEHRKRDHGASSGMRQTSSALCFTHPSRGIALAIERAWQRIMPLLGAFSKRGRRLHIPTSAALPSASRSLFPPSAGDRSRVAQ